MKNYDDNNRYRSKTKGLGALLEALGEVDAERFITLLNRDPFDYTTWQRSIFNEINVHQISSKALSNRKKMSGEIGL